MNPPSEGCRLCLDPFAESFTTIDSPELQEQMGKVFYFSIVPKQEYCSGVCQSCSYTISEFYQYSEKVRQNQDILLGNTVTNCDLAIDSKITVESVKIETLSDTELPETTEVACESEDDVSEELIVPISGYGEQQELQQPKRRGRPRKRKHDGLETLSSRQNRPEVLKGSVANCDPTSGSKISFECVKIETLSDSYLPETTEDVCKPKDEVSEVLKSQEDLKDEDSKISIECVKVEAIVDSDLAKPTEDACKSKGEVSKEEALKVGDEPPPNKPQTKRCSGKRKPKDMKADKPTKNFTIVKTQQERDEEDQLFNKHFRMICDLCGTSTETFTELRRHFLKEHKRRDGYVVCCNKKLFKRYSILDHIEFHANPDAFQCKVCGNKYKNKDILNAHMLSKHPSSGPFKCDHCPQSFAQKSAVAKHMEQHVPAKCPECNKAFACKRSLQYHMTTQHSGKDRTMVCDACGKEFLSKPGFDQHMKEHKEVGEQRLQCKICQAWLKNERGLRSHMSCVHNDGERKFECDICLQKYPHSRALYLHKLLTHAEPKHECEFCGKKFKKAFNLKEHRTIHTGEFLYSCEHCGIPKKCMARLYQHIKKQHPTEWAQKKSKATQKSDPV